MRILLLGKNGQVGWELQRTIAPLGEVVALDQPEVDFTDLDGLRRVVRAHEPNLIVNAAAYTAVDQAESEPDLAMTVNGIAPGVLAEEAVRLKAGLVHYSTDYVFDGTKGKPYTEDDVPNPLNVYGETKLAGDLAIQESGCAYIILRTSWVYGSRGSNFFLTMLRLAQERDEIRVVCDQVGSPTWCGFIAETTTEILASLSRENGSLPTKLMAEMGGLFNCSSSGEASWYNFAVAILGKVGSNYSAVLASLEPIPSEQFPVAASRPRFSVLDNSKLYKSFGIRNSHWKDQLEVVLKNFSFEN
jgi:dTDP-4-dehydrorhamnose reductase